jgi:RES domain-containing protein
MASSDDWIPGYRIVSPQWVDSAFSGQGAAKYGGRWNPPGLRVVYLAGSRSLAALEMLVHLTSPLSRAKLYCLIEARIPAAAILDAPLAPNPATTGAQWIVSRKSLALRVPSVLVPPEPNYLLNPNHPQMPQIRIGEPTDFIFDARL